MKTILVSQIKCKLGKSIWKLQKNKYWIDEAITSSKGKTLILTLYYIVEHVQKMYSIHPANFQFLEILSFFQIFFQYFCCWIRLPLFAICLEIFIQHKHEEKKSIFSSVSIFYHFWFIALSLSKWKGSFLMMKTIVFVCSQPFVTDDYLEIICKLRKLKTTKQKM